MIIGSVLGCFAGFYALVMLVMAGAGSWLARRTRGTRALDLLGSPSDQIVAAGHVARSEAETTLARAYAAMLVAGLLLFYLSIPFLILALVACTGLGLWAIFSLPRIPVKLVLIVLVVGLGGAWAMLKCIIARPGRGSFGLVKSPQQCPRLHAVLAEVAERVDTRVVDQVFIAPGSAIGVHQEGRGPFGMFGGKHRVLTLGLSTLHFLSVGELKSILAHEYAHFSHNDTLYSRFIQQVTLSIQEAIEGLAKSGGAMTRINPVFWFLVLYYKCYTRLSAGFSRSREFLADRMATSLYGSDVFAAALTKVATDGALFEQTIYQNVSELLNQGQMFQNMYEAFRGFRAATEGSQARQKLFDELEQEKESPFASHPTFLERVEAISEFPRAARPETQPAMELFDEPVELEKELTEFLAAYMYHMRQAQQAA